MRSFRKLAALCAVFLLACCLFSSVAYAEETPAPAPTETVAPAEDDAVTSPTDGTGTEETGAVPTDEAAEGRINAVPPDGTGTVIESATGEDGRQFYTITTPAGNVFYLVIDFSRQADNVYFLDAVTEKDLLALAEKSGNGNADENVSAIPGTETDNPIAPEVTPDNQTEPQAEAKNDNSMSSMILVIVVVLVGGGAAFYFKVYRKRKNADIRDEYEPDEPDDTAIAGIDEYETDQEDDSPPWEDEEE